MAEGFVLNIPQEMLNRLQKADEKIEKLDKASRRVGENIRLAFEQGAKGVDKFIGSLNSAQKILDGFKDKKINVGLNLDAKAVTDLKKQLENLGVKIPVGVTATGGGSGSSGGNAGESQSLKELLSRIVTLTKSVENLTQKIDGIKVTGSGSTSGGSGSSNSGKQQPTKVDPIVNSQNAKSITERIQAIKLLQKEMFNLDTTDKNYQRTLNTLNSELTRQQNVLKQVGVEISKIKTPKIEIPKPNFEPLRQQYQQNRQEIDKLIAKENEFVKKVQENQKIINNSQIKKSDSYNEKQRKTDLIASLERENQLHQRSINTIQTETQKYRDANQAIRERMTLLGQEYREKVKLQQANDPKNLALIAKEKKEYEELLKTIRQLEKEKKKAGDTVIDSQRGSSKEKLAQSIYTQTKNELDQLYKRRTQLEQKYGAELSAIQRANNMKDLQELIKLENEKLKVQEQAEQKALQQYTKLASERNRLLTEQSNNQKIINNPKTDNATRQQAIQQQQLIAAELQRNKQSMLNIEQQYQDKLATIQQRAGQQELQRIRRQKQQEIDEIRRAEQRRQDIQSRWDERRYSRPQGALQYSQNAKTINEQIKAIEYLKKAQKSLDVSTSQGKKQFYELEREIKKTENALRRYGVQLGGVREQSSHLFNISQQLGRALSLMFSVSQIGQYVSRMVNVRKEMELQQRSLQVLLQSKDKANELWNQTLDLAVKSPFRVKELVTYTKQLAAYRIESDKLFETNKMLADVSAGLGVDMQRLILAFGQVKSASFLRGTELRQFTEAGIPMLEELSKYFSEIYGKSISVAEVFDMISKRMVTFTDVENVFQRMTSAGGVFFNMQEELSQTTAGMISNLQDSIDLMFNEMGKRNQGVINTAIKWARGLVDNWETIGRVMKGTLVTLLLYKAATMDVDKMLLKIMYKWDDIKNIPINFTTGNAVMLALTAIIALFIKWRREANQYNRAIEEVNKAHDKFRDSISNVELGFSNLFSQGVDDIEEYKGKLQELVGIAQQSYNIEMDFEIKNLESIDEVSRKFDELKEKILSFDNLSLEFDLDFTKQSDRGWGLFQDYLETDLKDLSSAQKDIKTLASEIQGLMSGTIKDVAELDNLNKRGEELSLQYQSLIQAGEEEEDAQKVKDEINSIIESTNNLKSKLKGVDIDIAKSLFPRGVDESEYEYLQRITNGIIEFQSEAKKVGAFNVLGIEMGDRYDFANLDISGRFKDYTDDLQEATKELTTFYEKTHVDIANLVNTSLRGTTLGFEPLDLIDAIKEATDEDYGNLSDVITKELGVRGVEVNEELNQLLQQIVKAQDPNEVNEEFKRLVDILNKQSLDEEVSDYVYNSLKKIATDKELNETTFHEMLKQAEKYFGTNALKDNEGNIILETLDLDLIPEEKKPDPLELKAWQKAYNEEVEEILSTLESSEDKSVFLPLKIRTDLQGVATTQEKQLATINDAIDASQKELDRLEKQKANLDAKLQSGEITQLQYDALYTAQVDKQKTFIKQMTHLRDLLGGDDEKAKGGKSQLQFIKDYIALIRQLYDRYQELSQVMGSAKAKDEVTNSFRDAVEAFGFGKIEDIDFTNLEGIVTALEGVEDKAKKIGKEAVRALQKAIGDTKVEIQLMYYIQDQEKFKNKIKDMFSDYEVSLELEKLDIPANWAETFFGVQTKSLDEIQKALDERSAKIKEENEITSKELQKYQKKKDEEGLSKEEEAIMASLQLQVDGYKEERAFISEEERKIAELQAQQQEERLKTYLEYARKAIGEKAKIKLEEYRKLQEIDETFVPKKDEDRELFESTKKQAQAGVRREAREKQQKLEWEEFQKTDTFINIFDDLDSASSALLRHTLSKLNEFKDVWTDMPLEDMEKVVDAINKIENALAKIKPVKAKNAAKDTIEDIMKDFTYTDESGKERKFKGSREKFEKVVEQELAKVEAEMAKTKDDIANLETAQRLLQEGNLETVELMYKRDDAKGIKDVIKLIEQGADNSEIKKYIKDNNLTDFEDIFKEYQKQLNRESKGKDFKTEELNELLKELGDEVSQDIKGLLGDIIEYKGEGADIGGLLQTSQIEFNFQSNIEDIDPRENIDKFVEYLTEIEKGNTDIAKGILDESLTNQKEFLEGFNKAITENETDLSKVKLNDIDGWGNLTQYDQKFFDNVLAKMKGKEGEKKTLDEKDLVKIEEETIEYVNRVNDSLNSIKRYLSLVASGDTEGAEEYYKANKEEMKGYNKVLKQFVEAFEKATPNLQKVKKEIPKRLGENTEYVLNEFLSYLEGITSVEDVKDYKTSDIQNDAARELIESLISYLTDTSTDKKVGDDFSPYKSLFTTLDEEMKKLSSSTAVKLDEEDTTKIEEEIMKVLTELSEKGSISDVNVFLGGQENQEETQSVGQSLEEDLAGVNKETEDEGENQKKVTKEVEKQLKAQKKKLKQQEKENKKLNEAKNACKTIRISNEEIIDRMIEISKAVDSVTEGLDSVVEVMKVWGKDTDALELISGISGEVANSVTSMLSFHKEIKTASEGAEGFGKAMNSAMGIIGWIVMAVQLISKILTMVAEYRDKQIVKQIEAIAKEIEKLEKKYEKLSETIEEGFAESSIVGAYNEANRTLDEMLEKQQKMIDLNDSRKQTDDVKKEREEMEKEMEEMYEKQEELNEQYFSKITGGAFDSVLDSAGEFVDAWLEAFKETGDGLSGLEENFDEMFGQIVKQQASMLISDQFMKQWQDRLRQLSEGGLTTDEIKDWSNLVENDFPALNDALKTFYSNFEGFMDETSSLTGLQRGITEIQESTAQELASYLNSIRYIVMDSNSTLKALLSAQTSTFGTNPMIEHLQVIAQQANAINTLLNTLVKSGHSMGGNGLKVFI